MKFSASRSPLLALCQYAFRPDVTAPEAESSTDAKVGTVSWARAAALIDGDVDPGNVDLSPEEANRVDALYASMRRWIEANRRIGWRTEIKLAWSPSRDEGRELPKSKKLRDYSGAEGDEVCGSTDLVFFDGDGALVVEDVKTGVTPLPSYVAQARSLGLFAARAMKVRRVRVRLRKFHPDQEPEVWEDELDGFTLDAIAEELSSRLAAAKDAAPAPGPHCIEMWCPARLACPAVPAAIAELVPPEALVKAPVFSWEFVSHEHDVRLLDLARLMTKAADDLKKLIKARTPDGGVLLEDGRVLREGFHRETRFREADLIAKVRELAAKGGMTDEEIDRALADCQYTFDKSEGLRAVKSRRAA